MNVGLSTNIGHMSGLIGFCPIQSKYNAEYSLLMNTLYKGGSIEEKVFSIWVNQKEHNESRATYGGYDMEKYAHPDSELEWHNINHTNDFWQLEIQNMTISNSMNPVAEKQYVFGLNNKSENGNNTMIVDSGTSFLMLPH